MARVSTVPLAAVSPTLISSSKLTEITGSPPLPVTHPYHYGAPSFFSNLCITFPFELKRNIQTIALSPDGALLLAVDEGSQAVLVSVPQRIVLHHFNLSPDADGGAASVSCVSFSPDTRYLVICVGLRIRVWRAPGALDVPVSFAPLTLERTFTGHTDEIVSCDWSADGRYLLTASADMTARIYDLRKEELNPTFRPLELRAHRHPLLGAHFLPGDERLLTVARNGSVFFWRFHRTKGIMSEMAPVARYQMTLEEEEEERSEKRKTSGEKTALTEASDQGQVTDLSEAQVEADTAGTSTSKGKLVAIAWCRERSLLVAAFASGVFAIYATGPALWERLYILGVTNGATEGVTGSNNIASTTAQISTLAINGTGEWVALGVSATGQLLVWEWRSESFILRQQGHAVPLTCLAYSGDGQVLATGSADGRVKLWNGQSGLCFVTFAGEHKGSVSAVEFARSGRLLISASQDGTVRAWDLIRYRNFRTLTTPTPVQFISLAVDPAGEVIAAGTLDTFEVYLWSLQTGQLLEVLAGHKGPISGLAFDPQGGTVLASASWDGSVRLWEIFQRDRTPQVLEQGAEALALAFSADGHELAVATLKGTIITWDVALATVSGTIECRRDWASRPLDPASVRSLAYAPDGSVLLVAGSFPWIGMYSRASTVLLRRFPIRQQRFTANKSHSITDNATNNAHQGGGLSTETLLVRMSPTGRAFAAITGEGLLIYSLDETLVFDPLELDLELTPEAIQDALSRSEHLRAFLMAIRLNDSTLTEVVWGAIPVSVVPLLVRDLPRQYLCPIVTFLATLAGRTRQVELLLRWIGSLGGEHGLELRRQRNALAPSLRLLLRNLKDLYGGLSQVSNRVLYTLRYLGEAHKELRVGEGQDEGGNRNAVTDEKVIDESLKGEEPVPVS